MYKIVVVGYGKMFANLILGCIESGHNVVGVFRHEKTTMAPFYLKIKDFINPSDDKSFISSLGLHEIKAKSTNSELFRKALLKLNADILLVGSWSEKIEKATLSIPSVASINCHPSLLPKYRGPNPYAQVILKGEKKTGITFHLMDSNFDTGAILHQKEIFISETDTGETLKDKCTNMAKQEIQLLLEKMSNEIVIPVMQEEKFASYQKQLCEKDILIDFDKTAEEIDRQIRALTPWLKCYITCRDHFLRIRKYKIIDNYSCEKTPGIVIKHKNNLLHITCQNNKALELSELELLGFLPKITTPLFINHIIKIGDKAQ